MVSIQHKPVYEFGPDFFEAILKHTPTLEVLHLVGECYADAEGVDRLLCSAPNLKELCISNDRMEDHNGGYLDAQVALDSEWVCTNLEVFCCEIRNIPRPDITHDILGGPATDIILAGTTQESIHCLRRIYSKLARFTKLKKLGLGLLIDNTSPRYQREIREYRRQYDCLAMTLESGLELLRGLKELRIVGLEDMEV